MNMLMAVIKVTKVEPKPNKEQLRFYKVYGIEEGMTTTEEYSCWDTTVTIEANKLYSITYSFSKEDARGHKYKNINDIVLVTKDGENYVGSNANEKQMVTTTPIQKSYSELGNENQTDKLLEIVLSEVKELKRTLDDLSAYVYNNVM